MIRYRDNQKTTPINREAIRENQKSVSIDEEDCSDIIAADDGEVIGRKGAVAKLSGLFRTNSSETNDVKRGFPQKVVGPTRIPRAVSSDKTIQKPSVSNYEPERRSAFNDISRSRYISSTQSSNVPVKEYRYSVNPMVKNSDDKSPRTSNAVQDASLDETLQFRSRLESLLETARNSNKSPNFQTDFKQEINKKPLPTKTVEPFRSKGFLNDVGVSPSEFPMNESNPEEEVVNETWEEVYTIPNEEVFEYPTQDAYSMGNSTFEVSQTPISKTLSSTRRSLAEIMEEYQKRNSSGKKSETNNSNVYYPIVRGDFIIENNIDTTSGARTIDVVPEYSSLIENNSNPYQSSFRVSKENPVYTYAPDWQDTIGKNRWNKY